MIIKYGFTGTRNGLNQIQQNEIINLLKNDLTNGNTIEVHHGDCVGADCDFHVLCEKLNTNINANIKIVIHPPNIKTLRAYCKSDHIEKEKKYLERNIDIVDQTNILIACPLSKNEELRSGTWMTIRNARKKNKKVIIF